MNPKLEETIFLDFITSASTGAAADADSTPTCEVFEDANDTAILSPTVVKRTSKTGNYRVSIACTAANGFEAAKSYNAVISATIGAIAAKAVLGSWQMRTRSVDDVLATAGYTAPPSDYQQRAVAVTLPANPPAGFLVAGSFATDSIVAAAVAASAVTKIQAGLSTYAGGAVASVTAPVTAGTVTDKTGYSLAAAGLDAIPITDPGGVAGQTTFPKVLVALYRRFFRKTTLTATQLKTFGDDGTSVNTTQTVSDTGSIQTQGPAT